MSTSKPLPAQTALYRAVCRWHFLAGLFALPFLLNMAIIGGLYLFAPEINHILQRASVLVPKAAEATQGEVMGLTLPSGPDKSVEMLILTGAGESRTTAYADPYDGRLLGTIPAGGVMQIVRKIHSLQYFGFWASCLVEIAAGWAIVLALSGIFLWWPRGRKGGVVTIRATPRYRMFWRDLHAVTGLFVSSIIVFLAATRMPWSMFWGNYVQGWTTAAGLGQPNPPAEVVPDWMFATGKVKRHVHGGAAPAANLPWALEKAVPPQSMPAARPSISLDQAVAAFATMGLEKPYDIALPQGPKGAFTATTDPPRVEETRTVYLDQYSMGR